MTTPTTTAASSLPPRTAPARATPSERTGAALLAAGCLAMLIIGASLDPSPTGMGTHMQLGLKPCGWLIAFNKPCLTCGMTTAVTNVAHGRFLDGFKGQPAGALLAILAATVFWGALHVALTGSRLSRVAGKLLGTRCLILAAATILGAWAYKLSTWPST